MQRYPESFNTCAHRVVGDECYFVVATYNATGNIATHYTISERQCKIYLKQYSHGGYTVKAFKGQIIFKEAYAYPRKP